MLTTTLLLPLLIMLGSYLAIFIKIYSRQSIFRRESASSLGVMRTAKFKTIQVTAVLVLGFILCWTPYYLMTFWYVQFNYRRLNINK